MKITKAKIKEFINNSRKMYHLTTNKYFEQIAKKCYIILDENKVPILHDDYETFVVLNDINLAKEESMEYPNASVVNEYEYYKSMGILSEK